MMDGDIGYIVNNAIRATDPEQNVYDIISNRKYALPPVVISIGKAAVSMARGASRALDGNMKRGVIVTKYAHAVEVPQGFDIYEAGHPVPDENSVVGANAALEAVKGLTADDAVIFLVSGGGSALFEKPLVSLDRLQAITGEMLKKGCEINEINSVRKKLSAIKGGRFAAACEPARVENLLLSDVLGDDPCVIASGPTVPDVDPELLAYETAKKYALGFTESELDLLKVPKPRIARADVEYVGNLRILTQSAKASAEKLGYRASILTESLTGEARDCAREFAELVLEEKKHSPGEKLAFIMGGETTVTIKGDGKGGRNQEFALAAAKYINGADGVSIFAFGSDGTDGPTDNAGGFVDGGTAQRLRDIGKSVDAFLDNNDSAAALGLVGGLIVTGPTGTNVNDLYMALVN